MKPNHTIATGTLRFAAFACLLLSCLAVGCPGRKAVHQPGQPDQNKLAAGEQSAEGSPAKRELIKEYLAGDNPDQRQFALLFVLHFKLQEYRDILGQQSVNDPLAAVVVDCLSGDGKDSEAWLDLYPGNQGQAQWFGALYGFECTNQFTPDFWLRALAVTEANDITTFCSGMARLDLEPGGPVQIDTALAERLDALHKESAPSDVLRRFAIDSLLGLRGGRSIDFKSYLTAPALLNTTPTQWAGLLRHAPPATWSEMLTAAADNPVLSQLLLGAAAMAGPPGLQFPGKLRAADAGSANAEQLALLYVDKQIERFPLKQIVTLEQFKGDVAESQKRYKAEQDKGDSADQQALDDAMKSLTEINDLSRGVILELSNELRLACIRGDQTSVRYALQQVPLLPESAASALLSTVSRYGKEMAGDEELQSLAATGDRGIAYWLVLTWGDREIVQGTDARRQLLTSPNHENVMLGQAYTKWLEQSGLLTDS